MNSELRRRPPSTRARARAQRRAAPRRYARFALTHLSTGVQVDAMKMLRQVSPCSIDEPRDPSARPWGRIMLLVHAFSKEATSAEGIPPVEDVTRQFARSLGERWLAKINPSCFQTTWSGE